MLSSALPDEGYQRPDLNEHAVRVVDPSTHFFYIVDVMRDYLGEFEHIVLLAVLRLGENAYGVTVRHEIEARIEREVSIGAVYATLERLQAKGYVSSDVGEPTPERGGRSKRYFRILPKGVAAVHRTQRALQAMTAGVRGLERYA
jgi:PadR family transcriptional regulator PadR